MLPPLQKLMECAIARMEIDGRYCCHTRSCRKVSLTHFRQLPMWPWDLLSTFCVATEPSINFLCIHGSSVNFPCSRRTFNQLSVHPQDISLTFRASAGPSVNFSYCSGNVRQTSLWPRNLPSTFFVSAQPSVNFRHLSMHLLDLP